MKKRLLKYKKYIWPAVVVIAVLFLFVSLVISPMAGSTRKLMIDNWNNYEKTEAHLSAPKQIANEYDAKEKINENNVIEIVSSTIVTSTFSSTTSDRHKNKIDGDKKSIEEKNRYGDYCLLAPVLTYHHIAPESEALRGGWQTLNATDEYFEKHLVYLRDHNYNFVSAEALALSLRGRRNNLGVRPVVLTFDDGYDDVYNYAYPIAKKYKAIMNLMIPTALIGQSGYMTWDQLNEMKKSGLVFIYNHTVTHSNLTQDDPDQIDYQVNFAQRRLNEMMGPTPKIFTYPYGGVSDVAIENLRQNQFLAGFSTYQGFDECLSQIYILKRKRVFNEELSAYGL